MTTKQKNGKNGNRKRGGAAAGQRAPRRSGPRGIEAAMSGGRSELQEAGIATLPFFDMMINPEDSMPMRIPDGHAGTTAVFKSPHIVDLPYSGVWSASESYTDDFTDPVNPTDGYSEVILGPGSSLSIYHTLGFGVTFWDEGDTDAEMVPVLLSHPELTDVVDGWTQLVQGLRYTTVPPTPDQGYAVLPKLNAEGHSVFELNMDTTVGGPADILLALTFINKGTSRVQITQARVGYWQEDEVFLRSASQFVESGDQRQYTLPVGITGVIRAMYVEVSDTDPSSHWVFSQQAVSFNPGSVSPIPSTYEASLLPLVATGFRVVNVPELDQLAETQSERTTALSGLITYMGSTLADGGRVSSARLGMGISPLRSPSGDVYSYLASLPFFNDDFELREGIYSWWLPDSIQEHFYSPYRESRLNDLEFNSLLHFAMRRDQPAQGVRLRATQCLEVITRSRLYASASAPVNPSYETMITVMKEVPAVTINSKHKGILSRAFNGIKRWISQPKNWMKLFKFGRGAIKMISGI